MSDRPRRPPAAGPPNVHAFHLADATLEDVLRETRQVRRLFEEHLLHEAETWKAATLRQEAIMCLLSDIMARLP